MSSEAESMPYRIRRDDYAASSEVIATFPELSRLDVVTLFRLAFENIPERKRRDLVRSVLSSRPRRGRPRKAELVQAS